MIKFRAIPSYIHKAPNEVIETFINLRYNDTERRGLSVLDATPTKISGTYYEERKYIEIVNHPTQGRIETEQSTFHSVDYSINFKSNISIFSGNTRNISSFINFISIEAPRTLSIQNKNLTLENILPFLKDTIQECSINKISLHEFQISENSKASLTITSKSDAYTDISTLNIPRRSLLKTFRVEGMFLQQKIRFSASSSGTFTISSKREDEFFEEIISKIPSFY